MDDRTIEFYVKGNPKGQPRARAVAFAGNARVHNPGTADDWKALVAIEARKYVEGVPLSGPVAIMLSFIFKRPKGHFGTGRNADVLKVGAPEWHTSKPDVDNLAKAVLDVFVDIGLLSDDCIVCHSVVSKKYAASKSETGGVHVALQSSEKEWGLEQCLDI